MYFHFELELIRWIHTFRTELLDRFFLFLNYFDRIEFLYFILPAVLLLGGWKRAYEVLLLLFISSIVNSSLKVLFDSPRPLHLDELLGLIRSSSGGFPSGAAQNVVILSLMLIHEIKSPWKWALVAPYGLLISFSRIYLGAHFFSDLLGGFFIGYMVYSLFSLAKERVSGWSFRTAACVSLILFGGIAWLLPFYRLFALLTLSVSLLILFKTKSRLFSRFSRTEGAKTDEALS